MPLTARFPLKVLFLAGLPFLMEATAPAGTVTVSGRVIYDWIDESPERNVGDSGERASIFDRGLKAGEPVQYVRVELGRWIGGTLWDSAGDDITNELGQFSIETSSTPGILRVNAENDYVAVKESKEIPVLTDRTIHIDFDINGLYTGGDVLLGDIEIDDSVATFTSQGNIWGISRALYICGSVYRGARHVEELTSKSLDDVWVRLGLEPILGQGGTAWYDKYLALHRTIHLPGTDAAIVEHEYGHVIEDEIGAFGAIPSYLWDGGHTECVQQTFSGGKDNVCWAFIEGAATFYGAVNAYGFREVSGIRFFGEPPDLDGDGDNWEGLAYKGKNDMYDPDDDDVNEPILSLGDNWWIETGTCSTSDISGWTEPGAVEGIVARVIWDLVDGHQDTVDVFSTGLPEVAEVPIEDVLEVLMAEIPTNSPCGWATSYKHPVTLEQFCEVYRELHRYDTPHGVVPDLYIAYAFNGVAAGCAADIEAPEAASIASDTHLEGEWRNTREVIFDVADGPDDTSGSYYYFEVWDNAPSTELQEWSTGIGTEDFKEKASVFSLTRDRSEGDDQYYHLQTRDLAGHLGTTAHYGPIRIDVTPPRFTYTELPAAGGQYLVGEYAHFAWAAEDNLSGVEHLQFAYTDDASGSRIDFPDRVEAAMGSRDLYLDPDIFLQSSSTGTFTMTVFDRAANSEAVESGSAAILSPFDGPTDLGLALSEGRSVSGDLNGDGSDEVVLSGSIAGARTLKVIQPATLAALPLAPGLKGGDLFLSDLDRDGDLDLVAAGDFGGGSLQIYTYQNNGAGGLVSLGALAIPAFQNMVVRVVDLYGAGHPVLVYGGSRSSGAAHQELLAYDIAAATLAYLTGTYFRGGDFEASDIDRDGIFDFVTLGVGPAGAGSVRLYRGETSENNLSWTASTLGTRSPLTGDVDLGNLDDDYDLDFFRMYQTVEGGATVNYTEVWEWQGSKLVNVAEADSPHRVAQGDGHFADIYNDGWQDLLAIGRLAGAAAAPSTWYETSSPLGMRGSGAPFPLRSSGLYRTDSAWGDFDGDRDLDLVVVGTTVGGTPVTEWYRCTVADLGRANRVPPAPINLSSLYDTEFGGYVLSWQAPGAGPEETTETAFQYEVRVGTVSGGGDIVTWAHPAAGSQQFAAVFYTDHFERFVPLALGTYFWSVRTADSGWLRSEPAMEQQTDPAAVPPCGAVPGDCDHDGVADACEADTDHDGAIDDCDADDDNDGIPDAADSVRTDPYICGDVDGDGCDDCSNGVDGFGLAADSDPSDDGPDADGDGLCDAGDSCPRDNPDDSDGDGACDSADLCPGANDALDSDLDGNPDACDPCPGDNPDDSDGDGACDSSDRCPGADDTEDTDRDGAPDACDPCPESAPDDGDLDTVCDSDDICLGGDDRLDADYDGTPDFCDPCPGDNPDDPDLDGVCESADLCPGHDDYADSDGDGVPDACDNCSTTPNADQKDTDSDGAGDACDIPLPPPLEILRSDCNGDGAAGGISDPVFLLAYLFLGRTAPPCLAACDANGDGSATISDAIYSLVHSFSGGAAPPAPYPDCGPWTAADEALGCATETCP